MEKPGGKGFLTSALSGLDKNMLAALITAAESAKGDPLAKAGLLDLLRSASQNSDHPSDSTRLMVGNPNSVGPQNLDGFWPAEAGVGAAPWFGRILEKSDAKDFLSLGNRNAIDANQNRYLVDVGGRTLEIFSEQNRAAGELVDFTVDAHGGHDGKLLAHFFDPSSALPSSLKNIFANADPGLKQGMQLASHYLQDFHEEPYFGKLVKDFSEVLSQSGLLQGKDGAGEAEKDASKNAAMAGMAGAGGKSGAGVMPGLPPQKDLDGLLKLFLAFPRDKQFPAQQAKVWGEALRNPQAMLDLLKTLRPVSDQALLRSSTELQLSELASRVVGNGEEHSPEALALWLKKNLPPGFKSADILALLDDTAIKLNGGHAKESEASKFLLQALGHGLPKDEDVAAGKPSPFYFYQGQEWRGLQVTWEKGAREKQRGKGGNKEPLKVHVETHAKFMGKVNVAVTLESKGAKIDFKNQFHNMRDEFFKAIPDLEKSLDYLDFKVIGWSYDLLPEEVKASDGNGVGTNANAGLPGTGGAFRMLSGVDGLRLNLLG